jgi:CCR4-NOT transcription complex subunit 6
VFPTKAPGGTAKRRASSDLDYVDTLDGGADDVPPPVSDTDFGSSPDEWREIHNGATYTCCEEDVGRVLKVECKAVSASNAQECIAGPVVVYTSPVLAAPTCPPARSLRQVSHGGWGANVSPAGKFRVLSYNILAEVYATKQIYPQCDSWSLLWTYRKSILLQEIMQVKHEFPRPH